MVSWEKMLKCLKQAGSKWISRLISSGKPHAAALWWIPITRIQEQQPAKQSSPQRWKKGELRKCGLWRFSDLFSVSFPHCEAVITCKLQENHVFAQFSTVVLKQDWLKLVVNTFKRGLISENLQNSCITYTWSMQFLGTLRTQAHKHNYSGRGWHQTFWVQVPPWLLREPKGAGGPSGGPWHQEGHSTWGRTGWALKKTSFHVGSSVRSWLLDIWMWFHFEKGRYWKKLGFQSAKNGR